jgi:pyridoxamine 5'-phosphate oxidase family protein
MSAFTPAEIKYLQSQRLGRIATVGPDGQPHVVPVGFRYNPEHDTIDIGGHDFAKRKKFRDVQRNPRVAFVVDDVASVTPWRVRGIEIRGEAEILETGGQSVIPGFDAEMFRIRPTRIISWGLESDTFSTSSNYYSAHDVPS